MLKKDIIFGVALLGFLPMAAQAASSYDSGSQTPETWDVTLGAGGVFRPTFEGSDRYTGSPLPLINVKWNDMVSLGYDGFSAYWHDGGFRIGGGVTFDPGRKDHGGDALFSNGDDRLKGLGDINPSVGFKLFSSYALGPVNFDLSATKFDGKQNDGLLVNFGVGAPLDLTRRLTVTPHIGATWANRDYMETYFGVTALQASRSSFSEFTAGAGVKDVDAGVNATYRFGAHWFVMADVTGKELTGDARKSPISFSNTNLSAITTVGYHF